jgi:hypothetical protein
MRTKVANIGCHGSGRPKDLRTEVVSIASLLPRTTKDAKDSTTKSTKITKKEEHEEEIN